MNSGYKVRNVGDGPAWKRYAELVIGKSTISALFKYELITFFCANLGGALGLVVRKKLYPILFGKCGKGLIIGRNVTLRHPHKIHIGDNVIIDDNCVLDAKGVQNEGIYIGNGSFIGRNSIIYTKGGNIYIEEGVNIGVNCNIYSKETVKIGNNTMIAAYTYIMCGGQYDYRNPEPFSKQNSVSKGPTIIGANCWLGAKVVVTDNVKIEDGSVIGAGAIVTRNIPENTIALGMPAKVTSNRFKQ